MTPTKAPKAPTQAPLPMPTAAAAPAPAPAPKPKKERVTYTEVFPSEEAAVKEASNRVKGPRRAFKTSFNGKDNFVVANNEGRAGGVAFKLAGGTVTEIGKAPRAPKELGVDSLMAAINALPEDQRKVILEQLKK